jgi:protease-4
MDARQQGLVDRLGGYDDAVIEAATRAGLKGAYGVRRIEPELSWAQQLLFQIRSSGERLLAQIGLAHMGLARFGLAPGGAAQLLARLPPLQQELARWARLSAPNSIYAYCFCSIE